MNREATDATDQMPHCFAMAMQKKELVFVLFKQLYVNDKLEGITVEMMLDSGSSVSLIQLYLASKITNVPQSSQHIHLITASGEELPIKGYVQASIQLDQVKFIHDFVVTEQLVAPVILGVDFSQQGACSKLYYLTSKMSVQIIHPQDQ